MLFNSYVFILAFFPIVFVGYYLFRSRGLVRLAMAFLIGMSLVFYGWLNPWYVFVIMGSVICNYFLSRWIIHNLPINGLAKTVLIIGIVFNVVLIGFFKYYDFFISTMNSVFCSDFNLLHIALPLGISFFTIQQIGYLVDSYRGKTAEYGFLEYMLFVTFFPQLVAGPIVRHGEMIPQFMDEKKSKPDWNNLIRGFIMFSYGLSKKVLLADSLAVCVNWFWSDLCTATGLDAIVAMIFYTFEIYYDFSGYCDMASGIALCLNIDLPINFNRPYLSISIVDFWSRWHMTLTRFFREYLYFPLGGNRKGRLRAYLNIMIVFLVSGLWHGANWTFVAWGGCHGVANVLNRIARGWANRIPKAIRWFYTFLFVNLAWVLFRAPSIGDAFWAYSKMITGGTGFSDEFKASCHMIELTALHQLFPIFDRGLFSIIALLCIPIFIILFLKPVVLKQRVSKSMIVLGGFLTIWSIMSLSSGGTFIYFNF